MKLDLDLCHQVGRFVYFRGWMTLTRSVRSSHFTFEYSEISTTSREVKHAKQSRLILKILQSKEAFVEDRVMTAFRPIFMLANTGIEVFASLSKIIVPAIVELMPYLFHDIAMSEIETHAGKFSRLGCVIVTKTV